MNISIIGTGYVGLVSGACFASSGHHVICVDIDEDKVNKINNGKTPIYEKDLEDILKQHAENITATTSYEQAINNTEVTFICVGTPSKENGEIDLTYVKSAVINVAKQIKQKQSSHTIIIKSTVIPGTTMNEILPLIEQHSEKKVGKDIGLGMNPEFLREGVAIQDFLKPDRIVNGCYDEKTKQILREVYDSFNCPIVETTISAAEMIKYASNCFLATKISFINEIGNMCKKLQINTNDVAKGMGLDSRIGKPFLNAGIGWGGSCFPKDTQALTNWAKKHNINADIIKSTIAVNDNQPYMLVKLLHQHIPDLKNKTIGILGLAFKPDTDDIRDSRTIPIVKTLLENGAKIKAYDPKAMDNFKHIFPDITYCIKAEETLESDAILITTIWDEFKELDFSEKLVIDGRLLKKAQKTAKTYEGVCW